MIGGTDIVIPAVGDPATLDACVRIVQCYWSHARFENADTGEKYTRYGDIPFGRVSELFVYYDESAEAAWDADSPDSPPNSMLYLILSPNFVTAVLDDPNAGEMRAMIRSFRTTLWTDILNTYARAA